uniref:RNA polymerase-associated protein LEO1 n=1 Tax=Guillardia theta TaxID=55529 RepID=A0A7S4K5V6_GUITH|mmetsp:Transcript_21338/g.70719  ORF Transcript_21338/g.70719 Transcript_21338/m.70719 type:complete len:577 (+) Transcript_21338:18-1748(+)
MTSSSSDSEDEAKDTKQSPTEEAPRPTSGGKTLSKEGQRPAVENDSSSDSNDDDEESKPTKRKVAESSESEAEDSGKAGKDSHADDSRDAASNEDERQDGRTGLSSESESEDDGGKKDEEAERQGMTTKSSKSDRHKLSDDESDHEEMKRSERANDDDAGKASEASKGHYGRSGLSDSDSDEEEAKGKGDVEMGERAKVSMKDVFGNDESDEEEESSNKMKGQRVMLNKETGKLERGPTVDAPEHAMRNMGDSMRESSSALPSLRDLHATMPELPRPDDGAVLYYMRVSKHLQFEPYAFGSVESEEVRIRERKDNVSENMVRWRSVASDGDEKREAAKESNARFVQWSDGSLTLHVGETVLQVKKEPLKQNMHHLFVKHEAARETETDERLAIVEAHGVMQNRLVCVPFTKSAATKQIFRSLSKMANVKVDKSDLLIKKQIDENEQKALLGQKETMRIRQQSRREGLNRRRGANAEMTEEFLESEDVGGMVRAFRSNKRKATNPEALQRAKASSSKRARSDSESEESMSSSSSSSSDGARGRAAPSSSSSSSDEEPVAVKKTSASKKSLEDSEDSS